MGIYNIVKYKQDIDTIHLSASVQKFEIWVTEVWLPGIVILALGKFQFSMVEGPA